MICLSHYNLSYQHMLDMASRTFKQFVQQDLGTFPHFIIYAILEWGLIAVLFVHGIIAYGADRYAKFFELKAPCQLCSRIDHIIAHRSSSFYYNETICESHKKEISALAYCHIHRKLSNLKTMCEGCLLSFATEKGMHKDYDNSKESEPKTKLKSTTDSKDFWKNEKSLIQRCSCCGEPMKMSQSSKNLAQISALTQFPLQRQSSRSFAQIPVMTQGPAPSPRSEPAITLKNGEASGSNPSPLSLNKVMCKPNNESSHDDDEHSSNRGRKEEKKAVSFQPESEADDIVEEIQTPGFQRGNKFFGVPLTDSVVPSPSVTTISKKVQLDKTDPAPESSGGSTEIVKSNTILNHLKQQVRLDRKLLIELHMELDEERSASAVAVNNAMAMITRLQADKAAFEMEALQYQRMMEEQAEYDDEAIQMMNDRLTKREEEIKSLEDELDIYREKYGPVDIIQNEMLEVDLNDNHQTPRSRAVSTIAGRSDGGSSSITDPKGVKTLSEYIDLEKERSYLLGFLTDLEKKLNRPSDDKVEHESAGSVGVENKDILTKGVSFMRERLREIEADGGFLKHAAMTLQKGGEGTKLLGEIAVHLRKLREMSTVQSDSIIPEIPRI